MIQLDHSKRFTVEDYISALYDEDGRLIGPGQTAAVLRRAREDESLSVTDFKKICGAAYGLMKPGRAAPGESNQNNGGTQHDKRSDE